MVMWTGILVLPVTVILWVLSYLLVVKKRADFIAGFDRERMSDPDRYAVWVGCSAFLCGLGLLVTWVLIALQVLSPKFLLTGILVSAGLCIVLAFFATAKYRKR